MLPMNPTDKTIPVALLQQLQRHHQQMREQEIQRKREQIDSQYVRLENKQKEKRAELLKKKEEWKLHQEKVKQDKLKQKMALKIAFKTRTELIKKNVQLERVKIEKAASQEKFRQLGSPGREHEDVEDEFQEEHGDYVLKKVTEHKKRKRWVLQKQRQRAFQKHKQELQFNEHLRPKILIQGDNENARRLYMCQFCPYSTTFGNRYRTHSINHTMGIEFADRQRTGQKTGGVKDINIDHEEKAQCPFCSFRAQGPTGVCRHVRVHFDFQRYLEARGYEVKYERCWLNSDTVQVKHGTDNTYADETASTSTS